MQVQQQNQGSLYDNELLDNQRSDTFLSNALFQNSRSLSSEQVATVGMTFSGDSGAPSGIEFHLNQMSNRNMLHLLLSPRGAAIQNHLHLPDAEQASLKNEQANQAQMKQMEAIMRATLAIQQDRRLNAALLVNTTQAANHRNQEIDRLQREIRIMEQVQHQKQGSYHVSAAFPTAISTNVNATSTFLPVVGRAMLGLNQSAFGPVQQEMGNSGLFQHLDDRRETSSSQLQYQFPSALDITLHAMDSRSLCAMVSMATPIDPIPSAYTAEAAVNSHFIPLSLPVTLGGLDMQRSNLSEHQMLLRQQIEIFEATVEDVVTHMRGRNKPISLGQVGLRCKHCAHVSVNCRQKGSTYFPSTKSGVYQAAQNMSCTHIAIGLCSHMPASVSVQFAIILNKKQNSPAYQKIGSGRPFWIQNLSALGLIDTEDQGIRFVRNWSRNMKIG